MSKSKRLERKRAGVAWSTKRPWKKVADGVCPGCDRRMVAINETQYLCRHCAWEFKLELVLPLNLKWTRIM